MSINKIIDVSYLYKSFYCSIYLVCYAIYERILETNYTIIFLKKEGAIPFRRLKKRIKLEVFSKPRV